MVFYYLLFLLVNFFLAISAFVKAWKKYLLFILAVVLILVAGLRQVGVDFDSPNYVDIFGSVGMPLDYFRDYINNSFLEPAYYLIPSILGIYLGLDNVWIFLVFALLGVGIKFMAIPRLTNFVFLSVLVYLSHFFILHDMTQIRSGVASGILLLSIVEIQKRNFLKFLLLIAIGMSFHYSLLIFLPFYFLNAKKINKPFFLCLLFVPYILYFFKINILTLLQILSLGVISEKIQLYNNLVDLGVFTGINIFNVMFLLQLCSCTLFIIKSDLLIRNNKYAILLLKIYCIGAASFVMLSAVPVLAFRISELLGITQIILMPFVLYIFKPRSVAVAFVILFSLLYISVDLLYAGFLKPYFDTP